MIRLRVIESPKVRDQSALFIPYIVSGNPDECSWLHTCDACILTTWILGLRASLVAITGVNKVVCCNEDFVMKGLLYRGSTVTEFVMKLEKCLFISSSN